MALDVAHVVTELVELTGSQNKLARRLKMSQASISKFISGQQTPKEPQWTRIKDLYFELKGWRYSIDERLLHYDETTQRTVRNIIDQLLDELNRRAR